MKANTSTLVSLALFVIASASPAGARAHGEDGHAAANAATVGVPAVTEATASFGAAVADRGATPLTQVLAKAPALAGQQLISGRIGKVCQKHGCWMTLHDGDAMVRVETGHRFEIPVDAKGDAVVLGTLKRSTLDEAGAAHLRTESLDADAGESWTLDAAGIRIIE